MILRERIKKTRKRTESEHEKAGKMDGRRCNLVLSLSSSLVGSDDVSEGRALDSSDGGRGIVVSNCSLRIGSVSSVSVDVDLSSEILDLSVGL